MIDAPPLNRCEKLRLLSLLYTVDLSPSTMKLLHRFIDMPASLLWSSARLAISIRRSLRTVDAAMAELKGLGIITVTRRRRGTMVKVLNLSRVEALLRGGVAAAKKAAEVAKSLLGRSKFLIRNNLRPISILDIRKGVEADRRGATPYLLKALGLPVPPGRR